MKITNVLIFISFLLCLYVLTGTASTRCSKIGVYILDDIFGLNGERAPVSLNIQIECMMMLLHKEKIKFTKFNNNLSYKVKRACPKK